MKLNLTHGASQEALPSASATVRPHCCAGISVGSPVCGYMRPAAFPSLAGAALRPLDVQADAAVGSIADVGTRCDIFATKPINAAVPAHARMGLGIPLWLGRRSGDDLFCRRVERSPPPGKCAPLCTTHGSVVSVMSGPRPQRSSWRRPRRQRQRRCAGMPVGATSQRAFGATRSAGRSGAHRPLQEPLGLLPQLSPSASGIPAFDAAPWHQTRFIPELRSSNRTALEAFRRYEASPKVAILNYCDLPKNLSDPGRAARLRSMLGHVGALLLVCVGRDRKLDGLSIQHYDYVARLIGADAVVSPDDYIYECDSAHSMFQAGHLMRARKRALDLLGMPQRPYSVIGSAPGRDGAEIGGSLQFLLDHGVRDCAFPCGDHLKGGRYKVLAQSFVRRARGMRMWSLLLGVSWPDLLRSLAPSCFSNSEASFGPPHDRAVGSQTLDLPSGQAPPATSLDRHLACLNRNRDLAGTLRR